MKFFTFVFSFLFVRNWCTGEMELSRPRVVMFCGMLGLIVLGIIIAGFLQAPLVYTQSVP